MQEFLSLLSLSNIIALPWYVSVPGLLVVALFFARAVFALFSFRLIRAATNLVLMVVVAVLLSRFGFALVQLIGG
ncbi:MAG: hypothetical protein KDJ80_00780 [Nitratireductor sp.]|nr:hypothetical protein [Nitratireductor sp.]